MIGPDATVTLDFALGRLAGIVDKLIVYPDNMRKILSTSAVSFIRSAYCWR